MICWSSNRAWERGKQGDLGDFESVVAVCTRWASFLFFRNCRSAGIFTHDRLSRAHREWSEKEENFNIQHSHVRGRLYLSAQQIKRQGWWAAAVERPHWVLLLTTKNTRWLYHLHRLTKLNYSRFINVLGVSSFAATFRLVGSEFDVEITRPFCLVNSLDGVTVWWRFCLTLPAC